MRKVATRQDPVPVPRKKPRTEVTVKKPELEPGEIKKESLSEAESDDKIVTRSKASDNYVTKEGAVKKQQTQTTAKSDLKIANVFRIDSKDGSLCFDDDLKTLRKSARRPVPTEKMRELEKVKTPTKIAEKIEENAKATKNQITVKTPQTINNSVKPQQNNNSNSGNSSTPSTPDETVKSRPQWQKIVSKDGQRTKVILTPTTKNDRIVYMKRIMQPQVLTPSTSVTTKVTPTTTPSSQQKVVLVKRSPSGSHPKFIPMSKANISGLNSNSIVIKKMPHKQQIQMKPHTDSPSKMLAYKPATVLSKSILTQLGKIQVSNGKPMAVKFLTREPGQIKTPVMNPQTSAKSSIVERIDKMEGSEKVDKPEVLRPKMEMSGNQYVKQLESENHTLKGILADMYSDMREMKMKIDSWEASIKKFLENKTSLSTASTSSGSTTLTSSSSTIGLGSQPPQIKFKTETNKVFKMPKLPITDMTVFTNFESDLSYRKFYELVFSRLSEMVPSRLARRTLHRYLRSIIDDDLLLNFVWDYKLSRVMGNEHKLEMVKFVNFQNLLFSLISHHKVVSNPKGIKWSELEQFLKNQLRNARDRAKAKLNRSRIVEDEVAGASLGKSDEGMDTSGDHEKEKIGSDLDVADGSGKHSEDSSNEKEDSEKPDAEKMEMDFNVEDMISEITEIPQVLTKTDDETKTTLSTKPGDVIEKLEEVKITLPTLKPEEPKKISVFPGKTINAQQFKDILNKAVIRDACKFGGSTIKITTATKTTSNTAEEQKPKSIVITKGNTMQIMKNIVGKNPQITVKPNIVIKKIIAPKKDAEVSEKSETTSSENKETEKEKEMKEETENLKNESVDSQDVSTDSQDTSDEKDPDPLNCT